MADIEIRKDEQRSRYEAVVDGQVAGYAEYRDRGEVIQLPHTVVEDAYEGQGVGSALARGALDDVRAQGKLVVPTCPFIASYVERHDEYADLVATGS